MFTRKISSPDEVIPVYGEMSLTVYTFLPRWNFIPGWKKEKKTCKHFILGWNFKMSMFLINFWRMYSNMLSKVNVFEHNESMNEWNIRPLYKKSEVPKEKEWFQHNESMNKWNIRPLYKKKWSPKRKRMKTTTKKSKTKKHFISIIFFVEFRKNWNSIFL